MKAVSHIYCGWFIDGSGGPVQENVVLTVEGGQITAIGQKPKDRSGVSGNIIDLSSCTILPPLVDCHLHLFMSATIDKNIRDAQLTASCEELTPVIRRHVYDLFSHGVLGFRDAGDKEGCARSWCRSGDMHPGVIAQCAGRAYHRMRRYGGLIGREVGPGERLADVYLQSHGEGDVVKLVNSGLNSLHVFGKETSPQFSEEELRELVEIANDKDKKVMVHANGAEPVRRAVVAGCHSIEHGFFMGEENLVLMAEKGTYWVPTVFAMKACYKNIRYTRGEADLKVIEKTVEHQVAQLRRARELGVKVALGTDAGSLGVLHGESMVEEMKLFKQAGYSLPEIIQCATTRGGELLGLERFLGLQKGGRATFLVARGAPSQLPRKLLYLENIFMDGKPSLYYRKNPIKHIS